MDGFIALAHPNDLGLVFTSDGLVDVAQLASLSIAQPAAGGGDARQMGHGVLVRRHFVEPLAFDFITGRVSHPLETSDPISAAAALPKPRGMAALLWEASLKLNTLFGGVVGVGVGIVASVATPGLTFKFVLIGALATLAWWAISAALHALWISTREATALHDRACNILNKIEREHGRATVEAAVEPFSPYGSVKCVFIVRFSAGNALPMGAQVIISTFEGTHERPLGNGTVRPPQQDGKAVVTLDTVHDGAAVFVSDLLNKDKHDKAVAKIRIGPGYDLQNLSPQTNDIPIGPARWTIANPTTEVLRQLMTSATVTPPPKKGDEP